jgi:hypothetical protein
MPRSRIIGSVELFSHAVALDHLAADDTDIDIDTIATILPVRNDHFVAIRLNIDDSVAYILNLL